MRAYAESDPRLKMRRSDRKPKPVSRREASECLSRLAVLRDAGWFYPRQTGIELAVLLWLAMPGQAFESPPLDVRREWSKVFAFRWIG